MPESTACPEEDRHVEWHNRAHRWRKEENQNMSTYHDDEDVRAELVRRIDEALNQLLAEGLIKIKGMNEKGELVYAATGKELCVHCGRVVKDYGNDNDPDLGVVVFAEDEIVHNRCIDAYVKSIKYATWDDEDEQEYEGE